MEFLKCRRFLDYLAMVMENSKFIRMRINITSERRYTNTLVVNFGASMYV